MKFTLFNDENYHDNPHLFNLVLLINEKIGIYKVWS